MHGAFPTGFGRYELIDRLAVGGMAELFVATAPGEHGFQKKVVIKRLLPQLAADASYTAMFIDEAKITAKLVHPKIAQTFELGKVDDTLFIAMEYVDGIDVLALLREFASRRRRVEAPLAVWIAHETLDALDYAHNLSSEDGRALGIVHRDISPSNVLLSVRGDIKLVDFGIARAKHPDRAHKSKTGTLKGKYGYMSPEQVLEQPLDGRSDVFSVGVVLAELLTGRRLFAAANELDVLLMVRDAKLGRLDKYGSDIEPTLNEIVRKALKKPLEERWQSAAQFRDALAEWLFENRYRVTPKVVADVVHELRDSVIARRNKLEIDPATPGPAPPESPPAPAVSRVPSEDAAPMVILDAGDSMPVIQMSYEPLSVEEPPRAARGASPPMAQGTASNRAETVSARPRGAAVHVPKPAGVAPPPSPSGTRPPADVPPPPAPRTATGSQVRHAKVSEKPYVDETGSVEVPIADTISAALESASQIGLPLFPREPPPWEEDDESQDVDVGELLSEDPVLQDVGQDSVMRNFDDIKDDHAARARGVTPPSPEEALRKKPPTPPALSDISDPADDSGEFHLTSPLRVLFRLMTAKATGLLVVAVGGIKKEIYVRDGQPEYVSSNVASELFGNYLVAKGVLSDGELAMALAMMPHYGGKLGDTLVGLGLMKPLEVFRHLTRQVRSKIIDVCTWNKGSFGWYAGRENPREAFPLDFNAFEILGAGAMALSDDHIEAWIAKNAQIRLRATRTRRVGPERFEVKGLGEVCEMFDGKRTIAEIVDMHGDREERLKVGRMLCLLEACDLARTS